MISGRASAGRCVAISPLRSGENIFTTHPTIEPVRTTHLNSRSRDDPTDRPSPACPRAERNVSVDGAEDPLSLSVLRCKVPRSIKVAAERVYQYSQLQKRAIPMPFVNVPVEFTRASVQLRVCINDRRTQQREAKND